MVLPRRSSQRPFIMDAPKTVSRLILDIISEFALNKFDDASDRLAAGTPSFLAIIDTFVATQQEVQTCLPSFPFKSANKKYKVLGSLPDKAEELALNRLNTMCQRICDIYPPGARVTIVSDGMVYNGELTPRTALKFILTTCRPGGCS